MSYQSVTQSAVGTSDWVLVDPNENPFNLAVHAEHGGNSTYDIEVTLDNSVTDVGSSGDAFKLASMTGLTASAVSAIVGPIVAVRINVTAYTIGTVTLHVRQAKS